MRRFKLPKLSFRTKVILIIGWGMLFVTVFTSYSVYQVALREGVRQLGEQLKSMAVTGALHIDGDKHNKLTNPSHMDSPYYLEIKSFLQKLIEQSDHIKIRYAYTMVPLGNPGYWRYVVDAEPSDSDDFSPLGTTEDFSEFENWLTPLEEPEADEKFESYGEWGFLLSASAPIRDKKGNAVGVLSVDAEPDAVTARLLGFRRWGLSLLGAGILISLILSTLIAGRVTRPILELIQATHSVAQGDFNTRVPVSEHQELHDLAHAFNTMTEGLRERDLYKHQFERYVSHQVAKKILENPYKMFWTGERKRATILFCDVRDFTSISENSSPELVVRQLNRFFSHMIDIVFHYEGTLDKFMGDAIMAVFGAPLSTGQDEERAVRTALKMQEDLKGLNREWKREGLPEFRIGIGINTGDVVIGNIGSVRRMEFSAIGDNVNTASRIEELNKKYNTHILISESTYEAVKGLTEVRPAGDEILRGRKKPTKIYELVGLKEAQVKVNPKI